MSNEWTRTMERVNELIISEATEKIKREFLDNGEMSNGIDAYDEIGEYVLKGVKEVLRDMRVEASKQIDVAISEWLMGIKE